MKIANKRKSEKMKIRKMDICENSNSLQKIDKL